MEIFHVASTTMKTCLFSQSLVAEKKMFWRTFRKAHGELLSCKSSVIIPSRGFASFDRNSIAGEYGTYAKQYDESIRSPQTFWKEQANSLHWFEKPQTALQENESNPRFFDWFPDGKINTSYNCLDVHVKDGRGDQKALIYDSPVTGKKEEYTYSELLEKVSLFSGALKNDLGVEPGDRVVIYMPLIPQAAIAMLACARIGTCSSFALNLSTFDDRLPNESETFMFP